MLADQLEVFCPGRSPPVYPPQSKHLREQGEVRLRVDLDEQGTVSDAGILKSSGFARLDEAARAAVFGWRCNPAMRGGKPTRAVAIQTLEFVLARR
jgi:protein TonB